MPLAAAESDFHPGASIVCGIGVVEGVECVVSANAPTVRGGTLNPCGFRKVLRAQEIALENRLPYISLESGGADLPTQAEAFVPGGQAFRDLTRLSAAGIPTIAVVFGSSTAGGAYMPGMSDYTIFVRDRAKVFLGGPPLVKMATGEESGEQELGGPRCTRGSRGCPTTWPPTRRTGCGSAARWCTGSTGASRGGHRPRPLTSR